MYSLNPMLRTMGLDGNTAQDGRPDAPVAGEGVGPVGALLPLLLHCIVQAGRIALPKY